MADLLNIETDNVMVDWLNIENDKMID